jgi:hypothetical protein
MFTPRQYRARADEYSELIKGTLQTGVNSGVPETRTRLTKLADNGGWITNNSNKTVHTKDAPNTLTLTEEEGHILGCLGASVIMQWNTLPTKLQRELFDNASSVESCCKPIQAADGPLPAQA